MSTEQGRGAGSVYERRAGVPVSKFTCYGCGQEYGDLKNLFECVEDHQEERRA